MRFNWRRPLGPPIAADFGASSIRMLQLSDDGTAIAAAMEAPCELDTEFNEDTHLSRAATMIETIQADAAWTGNRVGCVDAGVHCQHDAPPAEPSR